MSGCNLNTSIISGVYRAALYENNNIQLRRPDITKPNEIDLISSGLGATIIIENQDEPKWNRIISTGENYKEMFQDTLSFVLLGLTDENNLIMKTLRESYYGFIMELNLINGLNLLFPTPVFLIDSVSFDQNIGSQFVTVGYRVPTFSNYLTKLNDLNFAYSFYIVGENTILAYSNTDPLIINE